MVIDKLNALKYFLMGEKKTVNPFRWILMCHL